MKTLKTIMLLSTLCFALGACGKKQGGKTTDTNGAVTLTSEEKTALQSEYKEEAQKNITAENADKVADELAKEIAADK